MNKFKVILLLFLSCGFVLTAQEEHKFFVGGMFSYSKNLNSRGDSGSTFYSVRPSLGYSLTENWQVGLAIGFSSQENVFISGESSRITRTSIDPFVRYRKTVAPDLRIYGELAVSFSSVERTMIPATSQADEITMFQLTLGPGLDYSLSERWVLLGLWGVLQYNNVLSNTIGSDDSTLRADIDLTSVQFGVNFYF